jgi:hypothetical protein
METAEMRSKLIFSKIIRFKNQNQFSCLFIYLSIHVHCLCQRKMEDSRSLLAFTISGGNIEGKNNNNIVDDDDDDDGGRARIKEIYINK